MNGKQGGKSELAGTPAPGRVGGMKPFLAILVGFFVLLTPVPAADGDIPEPADAVRKIYTEHLANKGVLADKEARKTWEFVFGAELCKVLKKPDWGFDPLVFAQDHDIEKLVVKEINRDKSGRVLVLVTFTNFGKSIRLVVAMNHTDHGYQIENIVDPESGTDLIHDLAVAGK